ncbi:hypothetical protein [Streptomyces sp. NPDC059003]|uniref:hypothetical protein n=1 Tax=Streptomyces sp. NPDC059003 TaxID=3346691 RepID=UPI0036CBD674
MTTVQDTPLIVPMAVDAFLFTKPDNRTPDDVDRRATSLDRLPEHAPMGLALDAVTPDPDNDMGIYLQWELPAVLRTGQAAPPKMASGLEPPHTGEFRLIPNRWLVTRRAFVTANTSKQQTLHWLIRADTPVPESDDSGRTETTPAAVLPGPPSADTGTYPSQANYGVAYPITDRSAIPAEPHQWKAAGGPLFLTANSTGLPEFCSYQPYNKNILSFHDLLADLTGTQEELGAGKGEITVNYLVVGWYSHQNSDVLNPGTTKLRDTLAGFGWDLPGDADSPVTGTVYAGTVLGVPWKEDLDPLTYQPILANMSRFSLDARPAAAEVGLAVGQSSMEACIAAVIRSTLLTPEEARLFSAFQHRLLDAPANPGLPDHTNEPDAQHALQYGEHASTFFATQGGRCWRLDNTSSAPLNAGQESALATVRKKLASLNEAQTQYNVTNAQCRDMFTTLKGLWWVSMHYTDQGPKQADTAAVAALKEELARRVKDRQICLATVGALATEIRQHITTGKLPHQLQPSPMPPFLQATNPVVVMRNLQARRRTTDHDGYLNGPLPVRRPPAAASSPLPVHNKLKALLTPPALACITPLAQEFDALVEKVVNGVGDPGVNCAKVRGSEGTGLLSSAPATDPYTRWWNQPWKPAFLEWSADLFPSHLAGAKDQSVSHPYTLSTNNPTPTDFTPPSPIPQYFHQKTVVSGAPRKIPETAVRHLSYFTTTHPILEDHTRYRLLHAAALAQAEPSKSAYLTLEGKIGKHEWNLTSATLAGVNEACAGRKPDSPLPTRSAALPRSKPDDLTYTAPPPPEQTTTPWFATPDPAVVTARVPHLPLSKDHYTATQDSDEKALGDADFPPFRSGQLQLRKLIVHDTFGRLLSLDLGRLQVAEPLFASDASETDTRTYTVRGDGDPINGAGLVDLRPRLHQGARLHFDYLTTSPDPQPLSALPDPDAANPVHGWLMATRTGNRHSLLCYTPQGTPLYDLHCLSVSTAATARPLPGCPYAPNPLKDEKFQKHHPVLFSFVKPLLASGSSKGHLAALLSSLDQSLAHTAPPSLPGPDSHSLALLIGRPIALASARLRLELDGPPLRPPATDALRKASHRADAPAWPVALGSPHLYTDGLLGYFTGTGFTTFYTHYPADTKAEQETRYTQAPQPTDVTVTPQEPTASPTGTDVSLLICPHTSTYAITDILPATALTLSPTTLDGILSTLQPAIPIGPLLAPPVHPDTHILRMPTPSLGEGTTIWAWAEPSDNTKEPWTYTTAAPPQTTDHSATQTTHAHTGYLTRATGTVQKQEQKTDATPQEP